MTRNIWGPETKKSAIFEFEKAKRINLNWFFYCILLQARVKIIGLLNLLSRLFYMKK